jgi:hypothetical protein
MLESCLLEIIHVAESAVVETTLLDWIASLAFPHLLKIVLFCFQIEWYGPSQRQEV